MALKLESMETPFLWYIVYGTSVCKWKINLFQHLYYFYRNIYCISLLYRKGNLPIFVLVSCLFSYFSFFYKINFNSSTLQNFEYIRNLKNFGGWQISFFAFFSKKKKVLSLLDHLTIWVDIIYRSPRVYATLKIRHNFWRKHFYFYLFLAKKKIGYLFNFFLNFLSKLFLGPISPK